ncbi:hypothetical protein GCM10010524_06740 [Streptomyces mexicanus]
MLMTGSLPPGGVVFPCLTPESVMLFPAVLRALTRSCRQRGRRCQGRQSRAPDDAGLTADTRGRCAGPDGPRGTLPQAGRRGTLSIRRRV